MPFKCTKCSKIVQTNELQDCECESNHFVSCPTIHFIHVEGEGPVFSRNQKVNKNLEQFEIKQSLPLRIACTDRKGLEQCTVLASLISCPKCMAFLASKRAPKEPTPPPKDKPFDTTNLDLSAADREALAAMGIESSPNDISQ
tara:strand:- start:674 stop:1102 length:429 start_codon:yes stop_codon:yes gene_type:complete